MLKACLQTTPDFYLGVINLVLLGFFFLFYLFFWDKVFIQKPEPTQQPLPPKSLSDI